MNIEQIAMEVAQKFTSDISTHDVLVEFAKQFLAKVQKQSEPVAWMDREGDVYPMPETPNWCLPHTLLYAHPPKADSEELEALRKERDSQRSLKEICTADNERLTRFVQQSEKALTRYRAVMEVVLRESQAVADDHHNPRYTRLDEALTALRELLEESK